jgi:hypothetical protein
MDQYDFT